MSLVVKLEDDLGEHGEWNMLYGVIPARDQMDFPILRGIDPYGKTVFHHPQMEAVLGEWERVRPRAKDESQREAWQKLKDMAQRCQRDRDLYLRFAGNEKDCAAEMCVMNYCNELLGQRCQRFAEEQLERPTLPIP